MTKAKARRWLEAVRELIQLYKDGDDVFFDCPLCKNTSFCRECPWMVFAKIHCTDHMRKRTGTLDVCGLRKDPRWVKLSLSRLRRWEKRLLAIIAEKKPERIVKTYKIGE